MKTHWQKFGAWILAMVCFGALSQPAAQAQYWEYGSHDIRPGDFITTIDWAWVKDRDRVLTTVPAGRRLVALEVQGDWVLVAVPRDPSRKEAGGRCAVCGRQDLSRARTGYRMHLAPDGPTFEPITIWEGEGAEAWIRGYVHKSRIVRPDDCGESRVIVRNGSSQDVHVRLVGPNRREALVPAGSAYTFYNVRAGHYFLLFHFADEIFAYAGEHFDVEASATQYSQITIHVRAARPPGPSETHYPAGVVSMDTFRSWGQP